MSYIGIRNSRIKSFLLGTKKYRVVKKGTESLAYDCKNHIEVLKRHDKSAGFSDLPYVEQKKFYGNIDQDFLSKRIERFVDLYEKIRAGKDDKEPIIVTTNGARLDGSHRASILKFLGIREVEVKEVYGPRPLLWIVGREVNKRKRIYEKFKGRKAYSGGRLRGRVLYTDFVRIDPLSLTGNCYHVLDTGEIVDKRRCYLEK
ncbi:MAG: hypothetical protein HQ575_02620 [Candidatus Omnitrophica bacterium]|nr:hypothetical protein [Candidatus Omnitrophota bacterium]